jgi:hypothetical protein
MKPWFRRSPQRKRKPPIGDDAYVYSELITHTKGGNEGEKKITGRYVIFKDPDDGPKFVEYCHDHGRSLPSISKFGVRLIVDSLMLLLIDFCDTVWRVDKRELCDKVRDHKDFHIVDRRTPSDDDVFEVLKRKTGSLREMDRVQETRNSTPATHSRAYPRKVPEVEVHKDPRE